MSIIYTNSKEQKEYINTRREMYRGYLLSDEWQTIKDERLKIDNHHCQWCGTDTNLEIHHLSYDNVYHEDISDLITLCHGCHIKYHVLVG